MKKTSKNTAALIAELAQANVKFKIDVINAVADLGEMTISDAQGLIDFGSFAYVQSYSKGCSAVEIAQVLLLQAREY